ncbi:MAG: RecX family transcriptional regulator [candidate division WOR-3 bacterium]
MTKDPLKYVQLLLRYRLRSESELRLRMKMKGFSEEDIESAIRYLKQVGLLNDKILTEELYDRYISRGVSPRKAVKLLKRIGLEGEQLKNMESKQVPREILEKIISKVTKGNKVLSPRDFRRVLNKLTYLGYNYGEARQIIEELGYVLKFSGFVEEE